MWNLICWMILGAFAGGFANKITNNGNRGCLTNIVIGVAGSLIGGWLGSLIGFTAHSPFSIKGCFIAVVGACFLIIISRIITK